MFRLERLSEFVNNLTTGWKAIIIIASITTFLIAAQRQLSAVGKMPDMLAQHMKNDSVQTDILRKMLCIQVSDHQHSDWTKCIVGN